MVRPDRKKAAELLVALHEVVDGETVIDTVAAAGALIIRAMEMGSADLPTALTNIDRLADDMKDELRRRLSN